MTSEVEAHWSKLFQWTPLATTMAARRVSWFLTGKKPRQCELAEAGNG